MLTTPDGPILDLFQNKNAKIAAVITAKTINTIAQLYPATEYCPIVEQSTATLPLSTIEKELKETGDATPDASSQLTTATHHCLLLP